MLSKRIVRAVIVGLTICSGIALAGETNEEGGTGLVGTGGGGTGNRRVSAQKNVPEVDGLRSGKDSNGTQNKNRGGGGGRGTADAEIAVPADGANQVNASHETPGEKRIDYRVGLRKQILESKDGNRPIAEVLSDLVEENNPFRSRELILAILLRKQEALAVLQKGIRFGSDAEKWTILSMIQKNIQWHEMSDEVVTVLSDPNIPDKVLARGIAAAAALDIKRAEDIIRDIFWQSENDDIREVSIRALGEFKYSESKHELLNALNDPAERIAIAAAESLGKLGDPNGYSVASRHLDHSNWFIRKLAAQALGYIGTDMALNTLELHLVPEKSPTAKSDIEISINRITLNRMSKAKRLVRMRHFLDSENRFVSRWAHKSMLKEFPVESIQVFEERTKYLKGDSKKSAEIYLILAEERKKGGGSNE